MKTNTFEKDVLTGLQSNPKRLYSKYFYDDKGSSIFQQIMHMPEYYLPGCETEVLRLGGKKTSIRRSFPIKGFMIVMRVGSQAMESKTALFLDAQWSGKQEVKSDV